MKYIYEGELRITQEYAFGEIGADTDTYTIDGQEISMYDIVKPLAKRLIKDDLYGDGRVESFGHVRITIERPEEVEK